MNNATTKPPFKTPRPRWFVLVLGALALVAALQLSVARVASAASHRLIYPSALTLQGTRDVAVYNVNGIGTLGTDVQRVIWTPTEVSTTGACPTATSFGYLSATLTSTRFSERFCPWMQMPVEAGPNHSNQTGKNVIVPLGKIVAMLGNEAATSAGVNTRAGTADRLAFSFNYAARTETLVVSFRRQTKAQIAANGSSSKASIKTLTLIAYHAPSDETWQGGASPTATSADERASTTLY